MGFLIEINHPGQVHLLKYVIGKLNQSNSKFIIITKNESSITDLLNVYKIPFINIGSKGKGTLGKLFKQFVFTFRAYRIAKGNDLKTGLGSSFTNDLLTIFIRDFKSIHLSDDDEEMVPFITKYSYPFATVIIAPDCIKFKKFNQKVVSYSGYHEVAYLHPSYFSPDTSVLNELGIKDKEDFFILRFVALKGHHDNGHIGISLSQKRELIKYLTNYGKVFISSENRIEDEFEKYRISIRPEKIHSILYYASAFIGDSQTMTSEAAIVGTPAFKCNTFAGKLSVPNEIEHKYNLCYSFQPKDFQKMMLKLENTLKDPNSKEKWNNKLKKIWEDKIDVSEFIYKYIQQF
jgi:predicted glycosyltransferase